MGDKKKEQLLEELLEVQKMLETSEAQGQMIKKLQIHITNEDLHSKVINFFPYPLAIFTPQYTVAMANNAFIAEVKIAGIVLGKEAIHIFQYKINDIQLVAAITGVFAGETYFLKDLKSPFSMFSETMQPGASELDRFHRSIVFPVQANDGEITYGVIVLMP